MVLEKKQISKKKGGGYFGVTDSTIGKGKFLFRQKESRTGTRKSYFPWTGLSMFSGFPGSGKPGVTDAI